MCALTLSFNTFENNLAFAIKNDSISSNNKAGKLVSQKLIATYTLSTRKNFQYELLFYIPSTKNFQGLTFFDGYFYCGFDLGAGNGKIIKYDMSGKKICETAPMTIGHCAELGYRTKTSKIYIANGGGNNLTHIYVVDYTTSTILKNLNYESLGTSALLAIDNVHDYLILHTISRGADIYNPTFTIINLANMNVINTFNIPTQGVPQGLETDGKYIYLYTNNKITILNYKGIIIATYHFNNSGESEGLTFALEYGRSYLAMGYTSPNRIYIIKSMVFK